MIRVVEDYISIDSPDIDYVYEDFSHEVTIIDNLNKIISDLEQCIEYTTDEDDIRSDMHSIKLIRDYISIYGDLYK